MTGDLHFQNMTIAEDTWVLTGAHTLQIDNDTVLERDSVFTTQLFVQSGGTLQSEDLRLFGAELEQGRNTRLPPQSSVALHSFSGCKVRKSN